MKKPASKKASETADRRKGMRIFGREHRSGKYRGVSSSPRPALGGPGSPRARPRAPAV